MRKLGKGQSLVFYVPEEIKTKILALKGTTNNSTIDVLDVLSWSIFETFAEYRRNMPLWAQQGRRFTNQKRIWEAAQDTNAIVLSDKLAKQFLEDEAQSLEKRYRPRRREESESDEETQDGAAAQILQRCRDFSISLSDAATLEEEQERELSPEVEDERQLEKPASAQALKHNLHKDLLQLAKTGKMTKHSDAWLPAFEVFKDTTAADHFNPSDFPGSLLVSVDYSRTVQPTGGHFISDSYLRPVQWIITCKNIDKGMSMIVISPFEAFKLLAHIRAYKKVTLHTYLPRPSLQFKALDSLDLFTEGALFEAGSVPQDLRIQLNLFAGQLYLSSFEEYVALCDFLGLAWQPQADGAEVASDGFILKNNTSGFCKSPVKFMYVLMTKIRRNCDTIEKTHMGKILDGMLLEKSDFKE